MEAILVFLAEYAAELGGVAAVIAIVETVFKPFRKLFARTEVVKLDKETTDVLAPVKAKDVTALTVTDFIRLRRELKADIERDLETADEGEKVTLLARIGELESQINNPDTALAEANKRIADLEDILDRAGNDIGGDRIAEAKVALEQGDYSIADDIFAEIEAREEMAVQNAARAAFGRGEVAEAQIRWQDAYTHYKRAFGLHDTTEHLKSYARMTWRLAKGEEAVNVYEQLVALVKEEHGAESAEYATQLNNLAGVVQAQGRYAAAEGLFRKALAIGEVTIGTAHLDYAVHLNNLAGVVRAQGRHAEAEGLYREALAIDAATIGTAHPEYAKRLNNLGVNDYYQKKYAEARDYLEQALVIRKATLPADHPDIAQTERSLAAVNAELP